MRHTKRYVLIRQQKKSGVVWYYRLRGEKTKHSTGESRKSAAAEYVERILGAPRGARLSLEEFASGFFDLAGDYVTRQRARGRRMGEHWVNESARHLRKWILPALGRTPLAEITPVLVERFIAGIDRAGGTRNHILASLRIVLRDARRQGLIQHNPVDDVDPIATGYRHRDALSLEELRALFPVGQEELVRIWGGLRNAAAYMLMATAGMRVGEVCALAWGAIRWEIPAVLILRAVKAEGEIGLPKNGKPRSALLPSRTVEVLRLWKGATATPGDGAYVFPSRKGEYLRPDTLGALWEASAARAGIVTAGRYLGAHSLRHTYETRLRGLLPDEALRYMLGHQSMAMTERYDQATPEERVMRFVGQRGELERLL